MKSRVKGLIVSSPAASHDANPLRNSRVEIRYTAAKYSAAPASAGSRMDHSESPNVETESFHQNRIQEMMIGAEEIKYPRCRTREINLGCERLVVDDGLRDRPVEAYEP